MNEKTESVNCQDEIDNIVVAFEPLGKGYGQDIL